SRLYTRTLVSTNTSPGIQFGSPRVPSGTLPELSRRPRQVFAHRRLVALLLEHLLAQQFADKARDARVAFGGLDPRPASGLFVGLDRDVLEGHGVSVTRTLCTTRRESSSWTPGQPGVRASAWLSRAALSTPRRSPRSDARGFPGGRRRSGASP